MLSLSFSLSFRYTTAANALVIEHWRQSVLGWVSATLRAPFEPYYLFRNTQLFVLLEQLQQSVFILLCHILSYFIL